MNADIGRLSDDALARVAAVSSLDELRTAEQDTLGKRSGFAGVKQRHRSPLLSYL